MAVTQQPLHSQVAAKDEGENYASVIWAGKDDMLNAASAIRFELPADFVDSGIIESVVLNLYCKTQVMYESYRIRIGIPATTSQTLPANIGAITSQTVGGQTKTLGNGTFSPPLDHTVGLTDVWVAVDVTDMIIEAIAAGRLVSDYVVFTFVPTSVYDAYWTAHGLGDTNPPTLDLEYAEASPPPDPEIAQPENAQTRSQGSEPQPIASWIAQPANTQTRSQADAPQPYIAGVPASGQTRSHGSQPQPIATWTAQPANSQTRSQADEPQPDTSYVAQPANSQTRSLGSEPQIKTLRRRRRRTLFPADLFPADLMVPQ